MELGNTLEMTEADVKHAFGHLGLKVVDTSFIEWPHNKDDDRSPLAPEEVAYIQESRMWFRNHADDSVSTTQEIYDEVGKWIHFIRKSHKDTRQFRNHLLARPTSGRKHARKYEGGRNIDETIRALQALETHEKEFRKTWVSPRIMEYQHADLTRELIPPIIEIVKASLPASVQEGPNPIGENDIAIYAKGLGLTYVGPTSIITRDNHFARLHQAYGIQRTRMHEEGLPKPPYPLYVVIYGITHVRGLARKRGKTREFHMLRPTH